MLTDATINQIGQKTNKGNKAPLTNGQKDNLNKYVYFYNFNITPGKTCLHAPSGCKDPVYGCCFAINNERRKKRRWIVKSTSNNYNISIKQNFENSMIQEIKEILRKKNKYNKKPNIHIYIRIHGSGDFYSNEYFWKWVRIADYFKNNTEISFMAYTKEILMIADELRQKGKTLSDINIKIVFSVLEGFNYGSNTEEHICNLSQSINQQKNKTGLSAIQIIRNFKELHGLVTYTVHKKGTYNGLKKCTLLCIKCKWCYDKAITSGNMDIEEI
ncbi:hypothetical protein FC764_15155 [Clostridium botulinum]|nr:hypothetical protein [Clostridium botulinum]